MKPKKGSNIVGSFSYPSDKEEIIRELRVIAAREGKSQSNLICDIIEEYVKNHSEGNNTFKLDNWTEDPEFKAIPTLLSPTEKWSKYVDECSDDELTQIGLMSNQIFKYVSVRRRIQTEKQDYIALTTEDLKKSEAILIRLLFDYKLKLWESLLTREEKTELEYRFNLLEKATFETFKQKYQSISEIKKIGNI